ncbi:FkbM family methyltransferase [Cyanobium gracile UHCC 0139]|uniref:FkbM family methyltransferase n=1 Tax=Cyanobium gracile UHCC 0139 TaxID=3110308 RepID=A0ABU5RR66_9CYAN|nr:FkbM family methyltransferase [Cyanobium gracile]MEA5390271.1 FkbM family methyltransferase [Cyanobium gracile UHCC 0139]
MAFGGDAHGKQHQPSLANQAEGNVDVLIRDTFFPDVSSGVLVEVGAASPDFLSLGNSFRGCGWRVISVEPNPIFVEQHRSLGHEIQEFACGEEDRDDVPFFLAEAKNLGFQYRGGEISYESFSSLGIRGDFKKLFDTMADRFTTREIKVRQRRLSTILNDIDGLDAVDVLCIDTEGWELECLKGYPFERFQPKVLIIEDLFGGTEIDELLGRYGYVRWQRLTPNNVYVLRELAILPPQRGLRTPMTSYTGNLEDVLLRRCFEGVTDGFYVDIGAHHPTNASVTRWFYDQGWSGINVEPGDGIIPLRADRLRDINLELAVSDSEGETTFWVHSANTGTSSLHDTVPDLVAERAGEIQPLRVRLSTLPAILDENSPGRHIQFLKIDAEGAEDAIIAAADWSRHRPEVLVVESSEPYTNIRMKTPWQDVLKQNRYLFAYFDGINDFWVREESAHLCEIFQVPVNVLDAYRIHDPELESLRGDVAALRSALKPSLSIPEAFPGETIPSPDMRPTDERSPVQRTHSWFRRLLQR